jgi:valyl-tRNA synthetase
VDTTRPETIFGDVAVAVHSDEPRYKRFHGRHVVHPFSGALLPIVVDDELVNMELGTGVVKVTPAHDPKDYECGLRHELSEPVVINDSGHMCGEIDARFVGLDRFDAREAVVAALKDRALYVEKVSTRSSTCPLEVIVDESLSRFLTARSSDDAVAVLSLGRCD